MRFFPDGRTALSGSQKKRWKLWDVAHGEELLTFEGHSGPVTSVAFSPDGRTVLSGSDDQRAETLGIFTGREFAPLRDIPVLSPW